MATTLTDAQVHALAMAEQTGADDVYGGDWRQALKDAAAQWAAEGSSSASGMTRTGERALDRLHINLGLPCTDTTDPDTTPGWTPAWHCDHAHLTLRWNSDRLQWELRQNGRLIAALNGYPASGPARTDTDARTWASTIAGGPQDWIARPARSGAHHTHTTPDTTCTSSSGTAESSAA